MSDRLTEVVAAFSANDHDKIKALGWWAVWEALARWWAPRQVCTAAEAVHFAKVLGDEEPERILYALRALAGEWRPHPAAILGHLNAKPDAATVDVGRGRDRTSTAGAIAAVAAAWRAGERACDCRHHHACWRIDAEHVLRCRVCGGLEVGQAYAAEDAGLIGLEDAA